MGWVVKEMEGDDPNRKSNGQVIDRVDRTNSVTDIARVILA